MKKLIVLIAAFVSSLAFSQGYKIGENVKDFSLKNVINGDEVNLKKYVSAKGAIVVFTCNHCPFSQMYEQRIIDLHNKYAKDFPVIAINSNDVKASPDDSPEKMKALASEKSYPFPYTFDASQEVAKAFGAQRTPHVFILKRNGENFSLEFIGAIDDNAQDANAVKEKYVEKAIDEMLAGKPVSNKSVKAIGCTIKWKS